MSNRLLFSAIMLLTTGAYAQSAKVVQLTDADATQAKSLHDQRDQLDKKIKDFDSSVKHEYLVVSVQPSPSVFSGSWSGSIASEDGKSVEYVKPGWGPYADFEYSDDFKFIVPAKPAATPSTSSCYWNGMGTTNTNCIYPTIGTFGNTLTPSWGNATPVINFGSEPDHN